MNSEKILYSKGNNDECYTPTYGVYPILKYIKEDWVVWCPFDNKDSEYVKMIGLKNKVIHSHINDDKDFYYWEPSEHWDCIVSNPPFTNKRLIFERALSFNKPMALLMTNTWLNDKYSKWVFKESKRQMQLLMFDKRINYLTSGKVNDKITFSSSYFCSDILPRDIVIEELDLYI